MLLWFVKSFSESWSLEHEDDQTFWQYIFAAGISISTIFITCTTNPSMFFLQRLATRVRIALTSLIQRKVDFL
jgi:hypothetical protein